MGRGPVPGNGLPPSLPQVLFVPRVPGLRPFWAVLEDNRLWGGFKAGLWEACFGEKVGGGETTEGAASAKPRYPGRPAPSKAARTRAERGCPLSGALGQRTLLTQPGATGAHLHEGRAAHRVAYRLPGSTHGGCTGRRETHAARGSAAVGTRPPPAPSPYRTQEPGRTHLARAHAQGPPPRSPGGPEQRLEPGRPMASATGTSGRSRQPCLCGGGRTSLPAFRGGPGGPAGPGRGPRRVLPVLFRFTD